MKIHLNIHLLVTILSSLLVIFSLVPTVFGVIFQKGRENYYDNGYMETTNSQFQTECIEWHNYFRALHGASPLVYSPELERIARYRAIELAKKDGTNFYHHDNMDVGENLAWNSQEPIDCRIPLQLWYDEWKIYNFQKPHITARNGHFAQMVWKDSKRIGCGQAISQGSNGGTYTVCNYDPPGNWKNEELQNVSPPIHGYGIEFNPLGKNLQVQLPPVSTTSYSNKWPTVSSSASSTYYTKPSASSYYYGPKKSTYYKKNKYSYPYDYTTGSITGRHNKFYRKPVKSYNMGGSSYYGGGLNSLGRSAYYW